MKTVGLRQWIQEIGVREVCRLLDCEPYTVLYWVRQKSLPLDTTKYKIVRVSKGRVTYESMIEAHAKANGWG